MADTTTRKAKAPVPDNGTPVAAKPRRRAKGRTQINMSLCARIVPDGLLTQAEALLHAASKGYKTCQKHLAAITYHVIQHDKWLQKADYHRLLSDAHMQHVASLFDERTARTPSGTVAIRRFLTDMPLPVLASLAEAKGVAWSEDIEAVIDALAQASLTPMAQEAHSAHEAHSAATPVA